ncbi:hypothetical protein CROQUDRAFT_663308, partial [Cronartium quercuum f. sp. fusiforme G11]
MLSTVFIFVSVFFSLLCSLCTQVSYDESLPRHSLLFLAHRTDCSARTRISIYRALPRLLSLFKDIVDDVPGPE